LNARSKPIPDLKAAQAALLVARENVLAQRGAYYPSLTGSFSATRAKTSNETFAVPNAQRFQYSLFTPEVSVSFRPGCLRLEPANGRVFEGTAGASALCPGSNQYYPQFQRRRRSHPRGLAAGTNWMRPMS